MLLDEATHMFARLKDAFPTMALNEAQSELLLRELALLNDPSVLDEAVDNLIDREDRFPTIARIRLAYKAVNEARSALKAALAYRDVQGDPEIPEWVHVWEWHRRATLHDRQAANTTALVPVSDRPPVRMRDFPQFENPHPSDRGEPTYADADAYTLEEYEELRQDWLKSGAPKFGLDDFVAPPPGQGVDLTDCLPGDCADCRKPSATLRSYGESGRPLCPKCLGARLRVAAKLGGGVVSSTVGAP